MDFQGKHSSQIFPKPAKKVLITTRFFLTYLSAQSRTCPWVSADPRCGEEIGKVPGTNPSSRYSGQPGNARTFEATTVRAFLFSAGFPSAGVTEEAHLHCRTCGRVLLPINGRQSGPKLLAGRWSIIRASCACLDPGSPPAGSGTCSRMSFVLRVSRSLPD